MKITPCIYCHKPIHFIKTRSNSKMPCEPGERQIITEEGQLVRGYEPHWDNCPNAPKPEKTGYQSRATNQLKLPI